MHVSGGASAAQTRSGPETDPGAAERARAPDFTPLVREPGSPTSRILCGCGDTCPDSGITVTSGLDNGDGGGTARNGNLETGEVDFTSHVCDGASSGGSQLVDGNGTVIGTVLGASLEQVAVRTGNGYLVSLKWDGTPTITYTLYSNTGCSGTPYIYLDDVEQSIHAKTAVWSVQSNAYLLPNNPQNKAAISSQQNAYASYWDISTGACSDSGSTIWSWPASTVSKSTLGLPSTIVAPLTVQ
ncbi:hypothetical protein FIV42_25080 [Persicimonas caeni]|uniref:Uncharacterized protein n=1 Tax=Persicimonas caeni TaxID=2292766 RepID=A0A4Y6PZZ5_PERCE|nr:hypothetical protein [Persicimonas caeni]QDG53896.1 hypothetical protein FIV42_25080 [Persicimonas caeni]QED35117.1 hypothetical protein FRD00_25075 [Persicimonas caeni]